MLRLVAIALVCLVGCSHSESETEGRGCPAGDVAAGEDVVVTDSGAVRGRIEGETISFLGIPFAKAPVGELRWRAPQVAECWGETRDAMQHGKKCVQIDPLSGDAIGDEDCLTVDVYVPRGAMGVPVLFYIHGGDNIFGDQSGYDGRELAKRGPAIVVTTQYRVNAFGFLAHPSFLAEEGAAGNYGLLDQIAALRWVQRNIARFGGDPARVVVFGQSAGATNTCAMVASPLAAGLISGAMMQSGNCFSMSESAVASTVQATAEALGCDTASDVAACMRDKSAYEVVRVPGAGTSDLAVTSDFNPSVDGRVLPKAPAEALRDGAHNHVPLIVGTTSDEYLNVLEFFVPTPIVTEADYEAAVTALFKEGAPAVLAVYPVANYPTPRHAMAMILGDLAQHCPSRRAARAATASQNEAVRRFLFAYGFETGPLAAFGAAHGHDVAFFWNDFASANITPSATEQELAYAMMDYFVRFAATGDPNGMGAVAWPEYEAASDEHLIFDDTIAVGSAWRTAECDFWDALAP